MPADSCVTEEVVRLRQENASLREENAQLQDGHRRLQEQLADAYQEINQLKGDTEELRDRHEEQLRELHDEMKAGWAFESNDLRAGIEQLKEESMMLVRHYAELYERVMLSIVLEEAGARAVVEAGEEETRQKVFLSYVRHQYLPIPACNYAAMGEGLYRLYKRMKSDKAVSPAVAGEWLASEKNMRCLFLNTDGWMWRKKWPDAFAIPQADLVPFIRAVVCPLPALKSIHLISSPPMSECLVPLLDSLPATLTELDVQRTSHTVADLLTIVWRCHGLSSVCVDYGHCTDWGHFAAISDKKARTAAANCACRGIIHWY